MVNSELKRVLYVQFNIECLVCCTGYVPGFCHSTNLTVGISYVILARVDDDGVYHASDISFDAGNRRLMRRIRTACGLQRVYPHGLYLHSGPEKNVAVYISLSLGQIC